MEGGAQVSRFGPILGLAIACALASACAGTSPQPSLEAAEGAVQAAENAQARRYASSDLSRALDNLSAARTEAADKANWIEARRHAEKAEVDAEVAIEKSRVQQLRITATELQRGASEGAR